MNKAFKSNQLRLTLPTPLMEEVAKKEKEKVEAGRRLAVESVIVRNMKARKKLSYPELVQLVIAQLHMFKAQPKFIKEVIENLIVREFLARNASDRTMLVYLA